MKRSRQPSAFSLPLLGAMLIVGCGPNDLTLHYKLQGIAPADVVRVETRVDIGSGDSRSFYVDQPFRQVATGVGYEVRDVDGTGQRTLLVTHDATLGYVFAPTFDFRLLPPVNGTAPPLSIAARAVGVSDMIGQTMALAASFNKGAKLDVDLADQRCGAQSCNANQACCNGSCTAVQSDPANCGACGTSCGSTGDSCSGATCRCAGGSACTSGTTCCAGLGCIDLKTDPFHCGDCAHACNPGESCSAGKCVCGTTGGACPGTNAICCGGTACSTVSCQCSGSGVTCNAPSVCCGPACTDTKTDNNNCGMCGKKCAAPLACVNGACACNGTICATGDTCCGSGCANTANDPNHCGGCGKRCRAGEVCSGGQCLCGNTMCAAGQLCCGGTCLSQTSMNCGACGHACKMGEACQGGSCTCNGGGNCTGNQVCCPSSGSGGGGCFDPSNDPNHCGDCATQCKPGDACVLGHCMTTPCNPPCTNGNSCVGGQCRCNGGNACSGAQTCCGDGCKDLANDPANCNACGKTCDKHGYCCKGVCTPPDDANCTGCGQSCGGAQSCCTCPGKDPQCTGLACICL